MTGTSYGIISPLTNGVTMIVDEAEFDADRWYAILEEQRVTVWYTAPTAIRMLMKAGDEPIKKHDLSHLRFMASVGEPLNAEAVTWSANAFGIPFHDNWWQTETGGIMIANVAGQDVKPGSMGKPLPGITAAIVRRNAEGRVEEIAPPMSMGELALKSGWPSMFRAYLNEPARYAKCFADGWYLTGDLAMRDSDGYFWFVGRADDVIKSAVARMGWQKEGALGIALNAAPATSGRWIVSSTRAVWPLGKWVDVEQEVRLNEKGKTNGLLRVWLDGELQLENGKLDLGANDQVSLSGIVSDIHYLRGPVAASRLTVSPFIVQWQ